MIDPSEQQWAVWLRGLCYATFAAAAGALGYIFRSMDAGVPISIGRAIAEMFGAALVGLFAMWICQATGISQQWTAVTVGISGWLGATASIQVLQRLVWSKLGLTRSQDDERSP